MKKDKKAIALLLSTLLTIGSVSGLSACGGRNKIVVDETTIVVKVRDAGFGTDWLYELKGKFETAYAEQGYKVKIMTPDNAIKGSTLLQELALGYNSTKVDLYISTDANPDSVGKLGNYGILAENIAVTDICTCCNCDYLYSHRASNGQRGALAAMMELRKS